jgi:heptosyltransferase II
MPQRAAVVVRFSSLGDILLAAHVPSFLRRAQPGRPVLFVTKERYAEILRGHPDLDRVLALREEGGWPELVRSLRTLRDVDVYDLHGNWRSWRLGAALGGRARVVRASKHGVRRRLMVAARWLRPEPLPPLLRAYRVLSGLPPGSMLRPWLREALYDEERSRASAFLDHVGAKAFVLLGVGARWSTKRWPARHFAALGTEIERDAGVAALYAVDSQHEGSAEELRSLLPTEAHRRIVTLPFRDLAAVASSAAAIVSNDSAVLHLGPALGVPALGVFGSTIPAFGFARQGPRDAVAEIALSCRPCDVHGKDRCPLGHHACMERLTPDLALAALRPLLSGSAS